jgi:serine protease Do
MRSIRRGWPALFGLALALAGGCTVEEGVELPRPGSGTVLPGGSFRNVVQDVLPTIVFIQTEITPPPGLEHLLPGIPMDRREPLAVGMGSGVIFSHDGYILTNNHVVQDAERVRVVLQDRRHFEAEVIGRDPSTEVAVVRIPGNGFPVARLGDSDHLQVGDWVLALGSPLGLQFSVTAGIVSGVGRAIGILGHDMEPEQAAPLEHFIQTDATLSPGNSGGALINAAGEVIGINTAVAAAQASPGSVGFAIPSNLARSVAEQLIRFGEVRRGYLGVALSNMSPAMAANRGLERVEGAVVASVEPGSPAAAAGLQQDDVILEIEGLAVHTVSDLQNHLAGLQPGSTVTLRLTRGGREMTMPVELGMVRSGVTPE